jgi:hypothetical protein
MKKYTVGKPTVQLQKRRHIVQDGVRANMTVKWSMVAVGLVRLGWTRQSDRTEDSEDRRQRSRIMMVVGVRVLWRGNTWHIPKGCVFRHGNDAGLIQDSVRMRP